MSSMPPCPTELLSPQVREGHPVAEGTVDPVLAVTTVPTESAGHPAATAGKDLLNNAMAYQAAATDAPPNRAVSAMASLNARYKPLSVMERFGKGSASNNWS